MGKLNLLHHKSWHVWKRDNLEIVRKDEEKAQKGEELKEERAFEIAQERKLEQLRANKYKALESKKSDASLIRIDDVHTSKEAASINEKQVVLVKEKQNGIIERFCLFGDVEGTSKDTNVEHEAEAKEEKTRYEKQFTMTFEACAQKGSNAPWYAKHEKDKAVDGLEKEVKVKGKGVLGDARRKERMDPMKSVPRDAPVKRVDKKVMVGGNKMKSIEELRRERIAREEDERKRIVAARNGGKEAREDNGRYNSQFNPELAKKTGFRPY